MEIRFYVTHCAAAVRPRELPLKVSESGIEIGRALSCDLCLEDPERLISHRHARIHQADGRLWVTDLSRNGTLLNGAPLTPQQPAALKDGDRLMIGPYEIQIAWGPGALSPPRPGPPSSLADASKTIVQDPAAPTPALVKTLAFAGDKTDLLGGPQDLKTAVLPPSPPCAAPEAVQTQRLEVPAPPEPNGRTEVLDAAKTALIQPGPLLADTPTQRLVYPQDPQATQVLGSSLKDPSAELIETVLETLVERFNPATIEQHLLGPAGMALSEAEKARCWEGFKALYPELLVKLRADLEARLAQLRGTFGGG